MTKTKQGGGLDLDSDSFLTNDGENVVKLVVDGAQLSYFNDWAEVGKVAFKGGAVGYVFTTHIKFTDDDIEFLHDSAEVATIRSLSDNEFDEYLGIQ